MTDDMTVSEAQPIWRRHGLTGLPSFDVARVLLRLERERDAAQADAAAMRKQHLVAQARVVDIIRRALAGWMDDYKYQAQDGRTYVRWEQVQNDIAAAFDTISRGFI